MANDHRFCPYCAAPVLQLERTSPSPDAHASGLLIEQFELLQARVAVIEERLPTTNIISRKFWTRSIAVVGHQLALWGILYVAFIVVYLVVAALAALAKT